MSANRRLLIMVGAVALSIAGLLGIFSLVYLYVDEEKALPVLQILVGGFLLGAFLWRRRHPPPDARLVGRSAEELRPEQLAMAKALNQKMGHLLALVGALQLLLGVGTLFGASKWIMLTVVVVVGVLVMAYALYQLVYFIQLMQRIRQQQK